MSIEEQVLKLKQQIETKNDVSIFDLSLGNIIMIRDHGQDIIGKVIDIDSFTNYHTTYIILKMKTPDGQIHNLKGSSNYDVKVILII